MTVSVFECVKFAKLLCECVRVRVSVSVCWCASV